MQIEVQLSVEHFLNSTNNFIKSIPITAGQTFPFEGNTIYVEKVTVTDNNSIERESRTFSINTPNGPVSIEGMRPVVRQELEVKLVRETDLIANGPLESPAFRIAMVDILISLTSFINANGTPVLRVRFEQIDFRELGLFIDEATKNMVTDIVRSHFNQQDRPIDIAQVENMLEGVTVNVTNAGVAANANTDTLFLRLEVNGDPNSNQVNTWSDFFNDGITSELHGNQWAFIFDKDLLEDSIAALIQNKLEGSDKFNLQSDVTVEWDWHTAPKFNVSFSGELIDACTCFFSDIDVDTDMFATIRLIIPSDNLLRMHIGSSYDVDDAEVFCCALSAGLFWPVIGFIFADKKDNEYWAYYLLGFVFAFWGPMIAVPVAAGAQSPTAYFDDIEGYDCQKLDGNELQCDQMLNLDFGDLGGVFTAKGIRAIERGPVLTGRISPIPDVNWGTFSVDPHNFFWGVTGSCTSGTFGVTQGGGILYSTTGRIGECRFEPINDPYNIFSDISIEELGGGVLNIRVTPNVTQTYLDNPYPCMIRIISNVGIRIVSLGNATQLDDAARLELQSKAAHAKANCPLMIRTFPWQFFKEWLPDPPPDSKSWEEIWQIVVSDVAIGETIRLIDDKKQVWSEGIASGYGVAQLSIFRENQSARSSMIIEGSATGEIRHLQSMIKENGLMRRVQLKQIQLLNAGSIPLNGSFKRLQLGRIADAYQLRIITDRQTETFDIMKYDLKRIKRTSIQKDTKPLAGPQSGRELKMNRFSRFSASTAELDIIPIPVQKLVQHAQLVRFYGLKNAVYLDGYDNMKAIYDYSSGTGLRRLTTYHHRPWFDRSARIESVFARLSDDGKRVHIYKMDAVKEI